MASIARLYVGQHGVERFVPEMLSQDIRATALSEGARWFETPHVRSAKYEDLIAPSGLERECRAIAEFLNLNVLDSTIKEIANNNTVERQRERIENSGASYIKEHLLWNSHITSATVGDYSPLTASQLALCRQLNSQLPAGMRRDF
jgi:hypothetical protein